MTKALGNDYRRGSVYGTLFVVPGDSGDQLFQVWTLGIWHSFCILTSTTKGFLKLFIDGKIEVEINYSGFLRNSASNITLLNDARGKKIARTDLTDVNIWRGIKETSFIEKWSECEIDKEGDFLKWSTSEINLVDVIVENNDEPLKCRSENQIIVSQYVLELVKTIKFCKKLGGKVAVARDKSGLDRMIAAVNDYPECKGQFFAGYSDRDQEGNWTDINTGEPLTWEYWAPGEPDNHAKQDQDCAVYDPLIKQIKDKACKSKYCPICELELPKKFQLNGPKPKQYDTHFVMKNLSFFEGYMFNRIVRKDDTHWESVCIEDETIVPSRWNMTENEKFPIGRKSWTVNDRTYDGEIINISSKEYLFNIFIKQPGNFVCPSGEIIRSEMVCNKVNDCGDGYDEGMDICRELVQFHKSNIGVSHHSQSLDNINIKAFVSILEILDISQEKSTFTLYFWQRLQWFNPNVDFYFLQENYKSNDKYTAFFVERENRTWETVPIKMPCPTFMHLDGTPLTTFEEAVYVNRRTNATMDDDYFRMDTAKSSGEKYRGSENNYIKDSLHQAEFKCSFDNIKNYPFGFQNCSFEFLLTKTTAKLEVGDILYEGSNVVGQYMIDKCFLSCGKERGEKRCQDCDPMAPCIVTVRMSRNLFSVLISTFAPPFLMNVLNQASVYLKGDTKYDLIITVNVTIMMVLASIYLSVSGSLQSTPSIKPVELYLVFNLLYPFLVITVNVARQVQTYLNNSKINTALIPLNYILETGKFKEQSKGC